MKRLLFSLAFFCANLFAAVELDGKLQEWELPEWKNTPFNAPLTMKPDVLLYGVKEGDRYYFAIKSPVMIDHYTTIWIDSDNDPQTGKKIWGLYGGMEYFIEVGEDGIPRLFREDGSYVGVVEHSYNENKTVLELAVDGASIGSNGKIGVFADVNNDYFMPENYETGELIIKEKVVLPPRTDFTKKVGIVYSKTSKAHFYDVGTPLEKAYAQLFMSVQYQAMMSGVPFVLLDEEDLKDVNKIKDLDAIILPYFAYVKREDYQQILENLIYAVYHYHIGLIASSDVMGNYDDGSQATVNAYHAMAQLMGLNFLAGRGPVAIDLYAKNVSHPVMRGYQEGEKIISYVPNHWFVAYRPVEYNGVVQPTEILVEQEVEGARYPAVVALQTGARIVHFSNNEYITDPNILWSAIDWVVYGKSAPVQLQLSRMEHLMVARIDMDQSQQINEVEMVDGELYEFLGKMKRRYGFVASCYINIGNNPPDQRTDWSYSAPLYQKYMAIGNEIGTHSYTHPHHTDELTSQEIEFEFKNSMDEIVQHLGTTWRGKVVRGGAVPGMPESERTAREIMQYLDYLSGGYSGIGAGYPNAMGYMDPKMDKVYLSPNMSFDFTLVGFGVPVWDYENNRWTNRKLTPAEAVEYWEEELNQLTHRASCAIAHWPWHDYGPTTGTTIEKLYSIEMFTNTIRHAKRLGSEFIVGADLVERIDAFHNVRMSVQEMANGVRVSIEGDNLGKMSLKTPRPIASVDGWYAYDKNRLFLPKNGGEFNIHFGGTKSVTRVVSLPQRAELIDLSGDGDELFFDFKGEGWVKVRLKDPAYEYDFDGADFVFGYKKLVWLYFRNFKEHSVTIKRGGEEPALPPYVFFFK